jgi:hypothetical protein
VLGLARVSDEKGDNSLSVETVDEGDDEFCWLVFTSNIELEREREKKSRVQSRGKYVKVTSTHFQCHARTSAMKKEEKEKEEKNR